MEEEKKEDEGLPEENPQSAHPPAPEIKEKESQDEEKDVTDKAKEAVRKTRVVAKEAVEDARKAFILLLQDPMGGQGTAIEGLNEKQLIGTGVIFSLVMVLPLFFILLPLARASAQATDSSAFLSGVKLFLACLILPVSLALSHFSLGQIFGKEIGIGKSLFVTGVASLPLGFSLILGWIFGHITPDITLGCAFFGICISVLMTNASLLDIHKVSTKKAVWLTPSVLLAAVVISYSIGRAFF